MRHIPAIVKKETFHVLRDPRSLVVAILMPMGMLLIFGYAIDLELSDLPIGILDLDRSDGSRELIQEMLSSGFIVDAGRLNSRDEIEQGFRRNKYLAAIIIPNGFERDRQIESKVYVQLLVDGADPTTAITVNNYLEAVLLRMNIDSMEELLNRDTELIAAQPRFFFNPQLESSNFIVPGLVAMVMIMICALLTSIAITREKETGTLEQILTTPVTAREVIIGKVVPYLFIAALDVFLILLVGYFVYHVPMNGSWLVLSLYSIEFLLLALSLGLMISAISKSQQVAMIMSITATLLPTLLLSGFVFAHSSMPTWLQIVAKIVPATYYIRVIRGVMLVGESWYPLEAGVMLLMTIFLMVVATKKFKSRLD